MDFLKATPLGGNKYRILGIPFGGPLKGGKDYDYQFFSPKTDIHADYFDRRPVLFHHGQDPVIKKDAVGYADELDRDDEGWWVTVWLDRGSRWLSRVQQLIDAKAMYGSSGTLNYLAHVDHKSGEILDWPYVEQTLSPTPSNHYSRLAPAKSVIEDFDRAGIDLPPAVKGLLLSRDLDPADLPADLPDGGDAAAMRRLGALAEANAALLKTI